MARIWPTPQDMSQGDLGVMLTTGPFKQEQERQVVRKDNDLAGQAFLRKPISYVLAMQVIQRGD